MQIVEGIAIIDDAFSEDYCNNLISLFENNIKIIYQILDMLLVQLLILYSPPTV